MNKCYLFPLFLLCTFTLHLEAQNNNASSYTIDNIKGKVEIQEEEGGQWDRAHNTQKVKGGFYIKVEKSLDLKKDNNYRHIYTIEEPVTVDHAWEHSNPTIKQYGPDVVPMSGSKNDIIGFCFITDKDDWRTDNIVRKKDEYKSIALNHNSIDTLFAYIYWTFPESEKIFSMTDKIKDDDICILVPNIDNILIFSDIITVPLTQNSEILICYSRERIVEPKGGFISIDAFLGEMKRRGFSIVKIPIGINQKQ